MLETDVFEYFPIGHDKVTSALEGLTIIVLFTHLKGRIKLT